MHTQLPNFKFFPRSATPCHAADARRAPRRVVYISLLWAFFSALGVSPRLALLACGAGGEWRARSFRKSRAGLQSSALSEGSGERAPATSSSSAASARGSAGKENIFGVLLVCPLKRLLRGGSAVGGHENGCKDALVVAAAGTATAGTPAHRTQRARRRHCKAAA